MYNKYNSLHADGQVSLQGFSESDRDAEQRQRDAVSDEWTRALPRPVTGTVLIVSRAAMCAAVTPEREQVRF